MYLDILIGVVLLLTVLNGYRNGFFLSAISLFGIVINIVIAKLATPKVLNIIGIQGSVENGTYILFYTLVFMVVYLLIGLLLAFLKSFVKSNMRNFVDVFLGIIFGFVKGAMLSFVLLLFFNLIGNNFEGIKEYGKGSWANAVFKETVPYVRDYFPERIGDKIENLRHREKVEKYLDNILEESVE